MGKEEVRVVVVEDDEDNRIALTRLLELDGYQVRSVARGDDAFHVVSQFQPAVVLVDLGLPGLDGSEVTRQLRASIGTELVVIAVTGSSSAHDWERLEAAGVDFVLAKPIEADQLRRLLPCLVEEG